MRQVLVKSDNVAPTKRHVADSDEDLKRRIRELQEEHGEVPKEG